MTLPLQRQDLARRYPIDNRRDSAGSDSYEETGREEPVLVTNRVRAIMAHIPWYTIQGASRLATDASVSRSTISRLLNGQKSPSLRLATAVTEALSRRFGRPFPIAEVFSWDGSGGFPTPSTCDLCEGACVGCMPEEAYDRRDRLRPEYRNMAPGDWCRYPKASYPASTTAGD